MHMQHVLSKLPDFTTRLPALTGKIFWLLVKMEIYNQNSERCEIISNSYNREEIIFIVFLKNIFSEL